MVRTEFVGIGSIASWVWPAVVRINSLSRPLGSSLHSPPSLPHPAAHPKPGSLPLGGVLPSAPGLHSPLPIWMLTPKHPHLPRLASGAELKILGGLSTRKVHVWLTTCLAPPCGATKTPQQPAPPGGCCVLRYLGTHRLGAGSPKSLLSWSEATMPVSRSFRSSHLSHHFLQSLKSALGGKVSCRGESVLRYPLSQMHCGMPP